MNTSPRLRRGATSPLRPGLVFWGMVRGKEWWVSPEKFEDFRQKKNALARGAKKTESRKAWEKRYTKSPQRMKYLREYQRKRRTEFAANRRGARRIYKKR